MIPTKSTTTTKTISTTNPLKRDYNNLRDEDEDNDNEQDKQQQPTTDGSKMKKQQRKKRKQKPRTTKDNVG